MSLYILLYLYAYYYARDRFNYMILKRIVLCVDDLYSCHHSLQRYIIYYLHILIIIITRYIFEIVQAIYYFLTIVFLQYGTEN
jgi:hypothetical protein